MSEQSKGSELIAERLAELADYRNDSMSMSQAEAAVRTDMAIVAKLDGEERERVLVSVGLIAAREHTYRDQLHNQAQQIATDARDAAARERGQLDAVAEARSKSAEGRKDQAQTGDLRKVVQQQAVEHEAWRNGRSYAELGSGSSPDLSDGGAPQSSAVSAAEVSNSVDVQRSGRELQREEMIIPRRIIQTYTEVNGKFFAKDSNRLMFEDSGEKLATSTTDKEAIADMVAYAQAKQWNSLKLTGSQEFRREAWLQAESQGIRTQGYTPKEPDLAALKSLTQERSTNAITPLQERKREAPQGKLPAIAAPRHDINKDQAAMHAEASKNIASNIQALTQRPSMNGRSAEELTKLAYWRGIVQEETKLQPARQQEAVARFDKQAEDPQFLKHLNQETRGSIDDKTTDRAQKRDMDEHSL